MSDITETSQKSSSLWDHSGFLLRQMLLPSEMRGRVNALVRVIAGGSTALGALMGAVFAQSYSVRVTLIIAAVGTLLAFFLIVASPVRRVKTYE